MVRFDDEIDLRSDGLGAEYEDSTIPYKLYEKGNIPSDQEIGADLDSLFNAYTSILDAAKEPEFKLPIPQEHNGPASNAEFDRPSAMQEPVQAVEAAGLIFEPWQTALPSQSTRKPPSARREIDVRQPAERMSLFLSDFVRLLPNFDLSSSKLRD